MPDTRQHKLSKMRCHHVRTTNSERGFNARTKKRASLVEKILASLDQPDKAIDELWAKEAESRIDAYETGNLKAISVEQVFGKYKK